MRQTIEKSAKPNSAKLVFLKPGRGAKQAKGPNDLQNLKQSRTDNFIGPNLSTRWVKNVILCF